MRFGVREICDVVMRAKSTQKIGNKIFYKNEPVIYFDSLKTTTLEGAATTVYAQGGRGNARLIAWEGERTVTFTMEDALLSPISFMILSGAGLIEATTDATIKVHVTETTDDVTVNSDNVEIAVEQLPYQVDGENLIYVMALDADGQASTEPYYASIKTKEVVPDEGGEAVITPVLNDEKKYVIVISKTEGYDPVDMTTDFKNGSAVLVDYYTEKSSGAQQIEITADKFGGNYYLEASTLFRDTNGVDLPAEFIIPNCKVQSNFTFTMASSGDPSTFTFTMDAFPDYTRFNKTKKVLAAIQIIDETTSDELIRKSTKHDEADDRLFLD